MTRCDEFSSQVLQELLGVVCLDPELLQLDDKWLRRIRYRRDNGLEKPYKLDNLTSGAFRKNTTVPYEFEGQVFHPGQNSCWKTTVEGLNRLRDAGRIQRTGTTLSYVRYIADFPAIEVTNLWDDVAGAGDKVYVVQTSLSVLERCILMTTDPGDLVLDPTCGSGTTAYVAEQWGRRWIMTDTSRIAVNIAKTRLLTAKFPYYLLYDRENCDLRQGFIYKKVPHVTLGSIANDEPPAEETLYDQPLDKKRLRVAGPFTVETLQSYEPISPEELARQRTQDKDLSNFEELIFAHLKSAGVKTGDKRENAVFVRIDRLADAALHAEGYYQAVGPVPSPGHDTSDQNAARPAEGGRPGEGTGPTKKSPGGNPSSKRKPICISAPSLAPLANKRSLKRLRLAATSVMATGC